MKQSVPRRFQSGLPILITESARGLASLRKTLYKEIGPQGLIECHLVDDFAAVLWEILRLRRIRCGIMNGALREALATMLKQLLPSDDYETDLDHERAAEDLARRWFEDSDAKAEVADLLDRADLDMAAIEAEAYRSRAEGLERLDRVLGCEMARRDKALVVIAEYRHMLAKFVQQASDQILEEENTPQLVAVVKRLG